VVTVKQKAAGGTPQPAARKEGGGAGRYSRRRWQRTESRPGAATRSVTLREARWVIWRERWAAAEGMNEPARTEARRRLPLPPCISCGAEARGRYPDGSPRYGHDHRERPPAAPVVFSKEAPD